MERTVRTTGPAQEIPGTVDSIVRLSGNQQRARERHGGILESVLEISQPGWFEHDIAVYESHKLRIDFGEATVDCDGKAVVTVQWQPVRMGGHDAPGVIRGLVVHNQDF